MYYDRLYYKLFSNLTFWIFQLHRTLFFIFCIVTAVQIYYSLIFGFRVWNPTMTITKLQLYGILLTFLSHLKSKSLPLTCNNMYCWTSQARPQLCNDLFLQSLFNSFSNSQICQLKDFKLNCVLSELGKQFWLVLVMKSFYDKQITCANNLFIK